MKKLQIFFALLVLCGMPLVAFAQEGSDGDIDRRLELAKQLQGIRPARDQVDGAIEKYVATLPASQRDGFRGSLRKALNYRALEKISIDAYVDIFTADELAVLIEYYSKPEVQSALKKTNDYSDIVYPEIIRMLDKALMSVKTGGSS